MREKHQHEDLTMHYMRKGVINDAIPQRLLESICR